ncbi:OmpA family protein [Shewanella sp. 10N.286.52.A9]|uniref:OmpA family protein n=1 Tax=Shewanella sp. 10N.286.52.A9 TaxID=3229711 RepID=UPI003551EF5C
MFYKVFVLACLLSLSLPCSAWVDTDKDGVPDKKDACPDTPADAVVLANGCQDLTLLSSETNVIDEKAAGVADVQRYSVSAIESPMRLFFEFADADLSQTQRASLQAFLPEIRHSAKVLLVGHTDNIGSEQFNNALSLARAKAVKSLLSKEYGVNTEFIEVLGKGSSQPMTDNLSKESRQLNRRVDILLNSKSTK